MLPASPPLETDLARIAAQTAPQRDDILAFAHYIDIMWEREGRADAELDALVAGIAAEVSAQIDCTRCANCCRSLTVGLTAEDIAPLAEALDLSPEAVCARYVDRARAAAEDEWGVLSATPCPLLRGTLCTVYPQRPQSCRDYPAFTPDFRYLAPAILSGADRCPIIFNVLARLKIALGWA